MKLIELAIESISYNQIETGFYTLTLAEKYGTRKLSIVIGSFGAQAISLGIDKNINPPRPMTHDLIKNSFERFNITIKYVIIRKLVDGFFFSSLICEQDKIEEIIDARTSDAIALAIRFNTPIYTYETILSYNSSTNNSTSKTTNKDSSDFIFETKLSSLPIKQLESLLSELVLSENYEAAIKVRDELSKRN